MVWLIILKEERKKGRKEERKKGRVGRKGRKEGELLLSFLFLLSFIIIPNSLPGSLILITIMGSFVFFFFSSSSSSSSISSSL